MELFQNYKIIECGGEKEVLKMDNFLIIGFCPLSCGELCQKIQLNILFLQNPYS